MEGMGGTYHKLKVNDIIFFKKHTQHELSSYTNGNIRAFIAFESVLGIEIKEK